jgi:transposase
MSNKMGDVALISPWRNLNIGNEGKRFRTLNKRHYKDNDFSTFAVVRRVTTHNGGMVMD